MVPTLPSRKAFLANKLTPLTKDEIKALNDQGASEPECCVLCKYRELDTETTDLKEKAVRIPCQHVFGEECLLMHFNAMIQYRSTYNDRCPYCRQVLYRHGSIRKLENIIIALIVNILLFIMAAAFYLRAVLRIAFSIGIAAHILLYLWATRDADAELIFSTYASPMSWPVLEEFYAACWALFRGDPVPLLRIVVKETWITSAWAVVHPVLQLPLVLLTVDSIHWYLDGQVENSRVIQIGRKIGRGMRRVLRAIRAALRAVG